MRPKPVTRPSRTRCRSGREMVEPPEVTARPATAPAATARARPAATTSLLDLRTPTACRPGGSCESALAPILRRETTAVTRVFGALHPAHWARVRSARTGPLLLANGWRQGHHGPQHLHRRTSDAHTG